jgi:Putative zinc-finger
MSQEPEDRGQCDAIRDELAELALGLLSGRRRSEVLGHVETCPTCTRELDQLSQVADALVHLAPEIEPPIGFEVRFAERLASEERAAPPTRARRIRRAAPVLAVAAAVVLLAFLLGMFVAPGGSTNPGPVTAGDTVSASLVSHGHVTGEVTVSGGSPAWIFMTAELGTVPGWVTCNVTLTNGRVETLGTFQFSGRYGAWGAPLKWGPDAVRSAQLVAPDGAVLATADLTK